MTDEGREGRWFISPDAGDIWIGSDFVDWLGEHDQTELRDAIAAAVAEWSLEHPVVYGPTTHCPIVNVR